MKGQMKFPNNMIQNCQLPMTDTVGFPTRNYKISSKDEYFRNVHKIPALLGIEQKNLGAYYTDESVVTYMLSKLDLRSGANILDPSCGCGSFIIPLYLMTQKNNKSSFKLYGLDIDKKAVDFAIKFLSEVSPKLTLDNIGNQIMNGDFLVGPKSSEFEFKAWAKVLSDISMKGGFDIIIGNPPFNVEKISVKRPFFTEPIHRELASKTKNMPIYFILRSLELLRHGGTIAFVLPKTLLYGGKYLEFRKYILQNYRVIRITEIGLKFKGVRGEQILIFIKKERPNEYSEIEFSTIKDSGKEFKGDEFAVRQNYFENMAILPTIPNRTIYEIVRKLSVQSLKISDFTDAKIFRGLSLGQTKIVVRPFDQNSDLVSNAFVRGRDITKFRLRSLAFPSNPVVNKDKLLQIKKPKIMIQNIFSSESGVISYLDMQGIATSETVTNVVISDQRKLAYVFGLLNSKLLNFYLSTVIFSGSKLTMHMDRFYLEQLPFLWDETREETDAIIEIAKNAIFSDPDQSKQLLRQLDKHVYELYGIDLKKQQAIEKILANVLSRKSMW
ncbi:MAG: N-6 DNA methylase [Candidatus Micrarchaeaceae archaeon]